MMKTQPLSGTKINNCLKGGPDSGTPEITKKPASDRVGKINLSDSHHKILIVDIDGVLAIEQCNIPLKERAVVEGTQDSIRRLKQKGYLIILCTSRFRSQKAATIEWLERNNIPFDDIVFGKPRGILYIDDRGYRFKGWDQFFNDVEL
jgi:hypothetical protein